MKRVVTGHNEAGKSIVLFEGEPKRVSKFRNLPGLQIKEIWATEEGSPLPINSEDPTDTIDYNIVLAGELWCELDDGVEVHLQAGDCLVQCGTRHAWRNKGSEPCVKAAIMVGAVRR